MRLDLVRMPWTCLTGARFVGSMIPLDVWRRVRTRSAFERHPGFPRSAPSRLLRGQGRWSSGHPDESGPRQSGKCCDRLMNMKRMRGRNHRPGGGGGGGSPIRHHNGQIPLNRNHVFDSNGPDLRIRGTAQQLFEKYLQLGRDATSSGDRVMAEGYFQHAEHYFRIINAIAQAAQQGQGAQPGQSAQQGQPGQQGQSGQQNQSGQQGWGAPQVNNQQRGRSMDEQDPEDRGGEDPLISGGAPAPAPYTQPAQTQPAQTQPAQTQPAQTQPAQTQPAQTQPAQTQPAQTQPAQSQPAQTQVAPSQPALAQPPVEPPLALQPEEARTEPESPIAERRSATATRPPRAPRPPRERRSAEPEAGSPRPETELSGA